MAGLCARQCRPEFARRWGETPVTSKVLIAGGGIGGLTAALCLARVGRDVCVFEQSAEYAEEGAGIQLSPNASRVLHHLGLEAALAKVAFLPAGTQFRHWRDGRVIGESALGSEAHKRYGAPYYHVACRPPPWWRSTIATQHHRTSC